MVTQAFIAGAKRTPFGAYGGALKSLTAAQLGGLASKAALAQLPAETKVDHVIFGTVLGSDPSSAYLARHVGHLSGLTVTVPALTVNRLCGSGFESVIQAQRLIALDEADVVLTGGSESMSRCPYTLAGESRFGNRYGVDLKLEDSLAHALIDRVPHPTPMGITAENLADQYSITREDCDRFALESQKRWEQGRKDGAFEQEVIPVELISRKATVQFNTDEHPRPQTNEASLQKLAPVFKKDGVVTAANASGICDGASANVVVSEGWLKKHQVKPLARIVSHHTVAVEPAIMGIGPVGAITGALKSAGLSIGQIDLFDVNEAFAAQWLAVAKELELPRERSNMFGGAIALGHPLGASGARIINNLTYNLIRLGKRYGVGAACVGGGQGIAVVLERC